MPLPSSIALSIVEKSSSVRIISAASFATSVPRRPIDIPISALFNAGASFTPSPVIATTSPFDWSARMIFILWSGLVRAKIDVPDMASASSSVDIRSSSSPRRTGRWPSAALGLGGLRGMPSFLAMARAVVSASPVIMITFTPPAIRRRIDLSTPFRGGSFIPTIPAKVKPWYASSLTWRLGLWSIIGGLGVAPRLGA